MSYIGNEPLVSATRTITEVTATAGQTVFTANGGYTVGYIDVFLNGAQLQTVDFTATNGTTITLTEAAQVGDVIRLVAWGTFQSANLNGAGLIDGTVTQAKLGSGVTGTGPAFSANQGTAQSLAAGTYTKLVFGTELFDTNSNYDNSTYRFTPTVAGYYQISAASYINNAGTKLIALYKNGVNLFELGRNASNTDTTISGSVVVYANGSTDYFEIYGLSTVLASAGAPSAPEIKWFAGVLVRAA